MNVTFLLVAKHFSSASNFISLVFKSLVSVRFIFPRLCLTNHIVFPASRPSAAGLYYLAELIEEYTVATSRIIKYMIMVS